MDAEIKAKWVAALRSGEYKQTRHLLRTTDDKYCCLGVLGTICAPEKWVKETQETDPGANTAYYHFAGEESLLPSEFAEKLGLDGSTQDKLTILNDGQEGHRFAEHIEPHSFEQIADWIEKNL